APHLTQFPQVQEMQKMSEEQFNKFFEDPNNLFWPEPMTLTLGKSHVQGEVTADVFHGIGSETQMTAKNECKPLAETVETPASPVMTLAGPWAFYQAFRAQTCIHAPLAKEPEIAIKAGANVLVPLAIKGRIPKALQVEIEATVPAGWKVVYGQG